MPSLRLVKLWNVVFFTITTTLLFYIDGKILHLDQCGKFDANLSIVMTNRKLVSFLIATKSNVNLQTCISKCVLNKKCQSINFKDEGGNCELLSGNSKTDGAIVRTEDKWVHYETDPLNREIGEVCEEKSPCPLDFCEDICEPPGFKCSCSSMNYTGVQCDVYEGIGDSPNNPLASCEELERIFPEFRNGYYWLYVGTDTSLTDGKKYCKKLTAEETINGQRLVRNNFIKTIPTLRKCWTLSFDIKPFGEFSQHSNVMHATIGSENEIMGDRAPAIWLKPASTKLQIELPFPVAAIRFTFDTDEILLNKFTSVNVSQTLVGSSYDVTIVIAGAEVKKQTNANPEEFKDVKLFVSDDWYEAGKAFIKNLIFENLKSCT